MFVLSLRLLLPFFIIAFIASLILVGETVVQPIDIEEVIERFPINKDSCWILLPVKMKGEWYRLCLDTGSSCTSYDKPLWHLMGRAIKWRKIGSADENITVPFFQAPDVRLGQFDLPKDSLVMGDDLSKFREDSGEEFDGILGMDFLQRHIIRVDFDRGEIDFLRAVGPDPGQRLAFTLRNGLPYVQIYLPGLKDSEEFVLDTGRARVGGRQGGSLREAAFEDLVRSGRLIHAGKHLQTDLSGRRICRSGQLDSLPFTGVTHQYLVFHEWHKSNLGLDILSRFVVTFDFPHRVIYMKKGRQFDRPSRDDRSGLYVRRVKGRTGVASVEEGSAAAKAGILAGDVLLQIDKEQIKGMTLFTFRDRLCEIGRKVVLTVQRGEQQMDVPVVLSSDK